MKMAKLTLAAGGLVAAAYGSALVWWRLWMYNGIPAPPRYLHWFISASGEGSYDLTELEMFGVLLATGAVALLMTCRGINKRQNKPSEATP